MNKKAIVVTLYDIFGFLIFIIGMVAWIFILQNESSINTYIVNEGTKNLYHNDVLLNIMRLDGMHEDMILAYSNNNPDLIKDKLEQNLMNLYHAEVCYVLQVSGDNFISDLCHYTSDDILLDATVQLPVKKSGEIVITDFRLIVKGYKDE